MQKLRQIKIKNKKTKGGRQWNKQYKEHHAKDFHVQWGSYARYQTLTSENILSFAKERHLQNPIVYPPVKDILI